MLRPDLSLFEGCFYILQLKIKSSSYLKRLIHTIAITTAIIIFIVFSLRSVECFGWWWCVASSSVICHHNNLILWEQLPFLLIEHSFWKLSLLRCSIACFSSVRRAILFAVLEIGVIIVRADFVDVYCTDNSPRHPDSGSAIGWLIISFELSSAVNQLLRNFDRLFWNNSCLLSPICLLSFILEYLCSYKC